MFTQANRRTVALARQGSFLSAIPGSVRVEACRPHVKDWERFLCLSERDLADIQFIFANRWVVGSSNTLVGREEVCLGERSCYLRAGNVVLDLRFNVPFGVGERSAFDGEIMVADIFLGGWRIERLYRYRPLIFLTAFRSEEYMQQARLCLSSPLEFGFYDGAIHVISDYGRDVIASYVPGVADNLLTTRTVAARDWVGYVASKYSIVDAAAAQAFQPLLFLDPGVMADADLTPMLVAILTSPRILASMEVFSGLATHPSVGASLIQRARLATRFAAGFNGGTLGIPGLGAHGETLRLIRTVLVNFLDLHGRESFQWADQEVANYVSFTVAHFDAAPLCAVRLGRLKLDDIRRQGLVHFFPARHGMPKSVAMRLYTQPLRTANRILAAG